MIFFSFQVIGKFYMDAATLVWNGHNVSSPDNIAKFLENLPGSQHTIEAFDAQPMASKWGRKWQTHIASVEITSMPESIIHLLLTCSSFR